MQERLRGIRQWLAGGMIALAGSCPAHADLLLSTGDSPSSTGVAWFGSVSDRTYWAASWTQSVPSTSTQVSAAVFYQPGPGDYVLDAFLLRRIGPTATTADVVASTSLVPPDVETVDIFDYDSANNTVLFSGLELSAGTYFLMMALSGDWRWTPWLAAPETSTVISSAPGFSAGTAYASGGLLFSSPVDPPWQAEFVQVEVGDSDPEPLYMFFQVSGHQVPEPPVFALVGVGLLGAALGRRHAGRRTTGADLPAPRPS